MKALIGNVRIKSGVMITDDLVRWCLIYGKIPVIK